jgi:diguanylate cyclase (GGDEF)-like protein/PAS domain S-box-containing protein
METRPLDLQPLELHPLLARQLRRVGQDMDRPPRDSRAWQNLLLRVGKAYREADQDRYLLERSQEISSRELHAQAQRLRLNEARLSSLLSLSSDWVWEVDTEFRFTFISDGLRTSTGLEIASLIGRRLWEIPGVEVTLNERNRMLAQVKAGQPFRDFTLGIAIAGGGSHYVRVSGAPMRDADGRAQGYRGVGADVTEATLAAQHAEHMARYDSLTGLPNRAYLREVLEQALARAARQRWRLAVLFIDLDGFKRINDNLGHAAGDEVLKVTAQRLSGLMRRSDLVARLGGDEFVALVEDAGDAHALTALARRMLTLIGEPILFDGRPYQVTGSVGISLYPDDAMSSETLLCHADAAMYVAKEQGKNRSHFFTTDLGSRAALEFEIETELRGAAARGELQLHYQAKVDLASGALAGVEALLRWCHPRRGMLSPEEVIPLAERRGLNLVIDQWVIRTACAQMRAWRDAGVEVPTCAVNLSPAHFDLDTLVPDIEGALDEHGIDASALEIEITENTVMRDPARAQHVLGRLATLGVGIAIDDFGTGYSSLNYLKRFPAGTLKLDRSFVRGLPDDGNDAAISRAVVAMAHSLGMRVVAEGVEEPAQMRYLREIGCDFAQGYLLGRPVPAQELVLDRDGWAETVFAPQTAAGPAFEAVALT